MLIHFFSFLALAFLLSPASSNAQTTQENPTLGAPVQVRNEEIVDCEGESDRRTQLNSPQVVVDEMPSLFLTENEIFQLRQAAQNLFTRPPTSEEVEREQNQAEDGELSHPSSVREISLGGILYTSNNDWVIWLNSEKITPKNIPPAIMDVDVYKDHIKLKWLDFQTNQIFPVKLRPHQRFNFDTRIFLPGR